MRFNERVKPVLLATTLAFMVGSYFRSDPFTRGHSVTGSIPIKFVAKALCGPRPQSEQDSCRKRVAEAFVPVHLACLSPVRDLLVCVEPSKKKEKGACSREEGQVSKCLQTYLEPELWRRGFSREEVLRLNLGNEHPAQQQNPKSGDGSAQQVEPENLDGDGVRDGGAGKDEEEHAEGEEAGNGDETNKEQRGPEVEVKEGSKNSEDAIR